MAQFIRIRKNLLIPMDNIAYMRIYVDKDILSMPCPEGRLYGWEEYFENYPEEKDKVLGIILQTKDGKIACFEHDDAGVHSSQFFRMLEQDYFLDIDDAWAYQVCTKEEMEKVEDAPDNFSLFD